MKKGLFFGLLIAALAIAAIFMLIVMYSPKSYLDRVDPVDVARIEVFDGATGERFEIKDEKEIESIVKSIQGAKMEWDGFAVGEKKGGEFWTVRFYDMKDKSIGSEVTIVSENRYRDGYFFYKTEESNGLEYIKELEKKYTSLEIQLK